MGVGQPSTPSGLHQGGAPGEIRTPDHRIRSPMLYPAELRARKENKGSTFHVGRSLGPDDLDVASPLLVIHDLAAVANFRNGLNAGGARDEIISSL